MYILVEVDFDGSAKVEEEISAHRRYNAKCALRMLIRMRLQDGPMICA